MKKTHKKNYRPWGTAWIAALAAVLTAAFFFSCRDEAWQEFVRIDGETLRPPQLLGVACIDGGIIEVRFDKDAWIDGPLPAVYPSMDVLGVEDGSRSVRILLSEEGRPGLRYTLEATVRDERGNTCSFLHHFYGFNPRIPGLLINEAVTAASTTIYTLAEIAVLSDGNMGGVTFFEGTKSFADKTFIFPSFEVRAGDFILLHFNTEGLPGEIDETQDMTSASGRGSSASAWDFWAPGTGNLSKDNDILSLYTNPGGELIDGLLYTSKVYEEGMKYNGFGTSLMFEKAAELVAAGGWKIGGSEPYPEDGFDPTGATSTRTICRNSSSGDTDAAGDWHIVPTGFRTPGEANSDEVYAPR